MNTAAIDPATVAYPFLRQGPWFEVIPASLDGGEWPSTVFVTRRDAEQHADEAEVNAGIALDRHRRRLSCRLLRLLPPWLARHLHRRGVGEFVPPVEFRLVRHERLWHLRCGICGYVPGGEDTDLGPMPYASATAELACTDELVFDAAGTTPVCPWNLT